MNPKLQNFRPGQIVLVSFGPAHIAAFYFPKSPKLSRDKRNLTPFFPAIVRQVIKVPACASISNPIDHVSFVSLEGPLAGKMHLADWGAENWKDCIIVPAFSLQAKAIQKSVDQLISERKELYPLEKFIPSSALVSIYDRARVLAVWDYGIPKDWRKQTATSVEAYKRIQGEKKK